MGEKRLTERVMEKLVLNSLKRIKIIHWIPPKENLFLACNIISYHGIDTSVASLT